MEGQRTFSLQTPNELKLNLGPKRAETFQFDSSLEERMRWVYVAMLCSTSVAFLVIMIVLVPLPQDLLVPEFGSTQLSPYDHLNMAMSVVMMQLTFPVAAVFILRSHVHCQRDLMFLTILIWTAFLALAAVHFLHFKGFRFALEVPATLGGLLTVGLKVENMLIHLLQDCGEVLYIPFRLDHLRRLLRIEAAGVVMVLAVTLCDAIFETHSVLRILGSIMFWIYMSGGLFVSFEMGRELGTLVRTSEKARVSKVHQTEDSEVWKAITKIRTYQRLVRLHGLVKFFLVLHVVLFQGYLWPFPENLSEMIYTSWGQGLGVFLLINSTAGSTLWYFTLLVGLTYMTGFRSITATHSKHQEEKLRIQKRTRQQAAYEPATDLGWQEKVEDLAKRAISLAALLRFYHGLGKHYMLNFNSKEHTTDDVVRQAIIPLSAEQMSDMSKILGGFFKNLQHKIRLIFCHSTL